MAIPIGHCLAGYAVHGLFNPSERRKGGHLAVLCVFAAVFPDLDVVPGIVMGQPVLFHQGVTHSMGFALVVSTAIALASHLRGTAFVTVFGLCFLCYASHLLIDFFGPDARPPYGIPLLWPLSDEYFISPVPIFLGVRHARSPTASIAEWATRMFDLYNVAAIILEVVVISPFVVAARHFGGPVTSPQQTD